MSGRPTVEAHEAVARVLRPGDTAVDATAGNGHDTVFLAARVGPSGNVLAFDIQRAAIESTRQRLTAAGLAARVELIEDSHARLAEFAGAGEWGAAMFNLGYLPGGDHGVITEPEATLAALEAVPERLRVGGVLTVVGYPGHPGGAGEAAAVTTWAEALGGAHIGRPARPGAPFLIRWQKR